MAMLSTLEPQRYCISEREELRETNKPIGLWRSKQIQTTHKLPKKYEIQLKDCELGEK
jgi:hypothetical protein